MKRNFKSFLSIILSLAVAIASLTCVSFLSLAEEPVEEVTVKDGPFDFTDPTDLAFGTSAEVQSGKLRVDIASNYGTSKLRIPYELKSDTAYSIKFKLKAKVTADTYITLKTAYAKNVDEWVGVFDHTVADSFCASENISVSKSKNNQWIDVEYDFTTGVLTEDAKYLGFFIQANKACTIYIDNLQIATVDNKDLKYDFSESSQVPYVTNYLVAVQDGELTYTSTSWGSNMSATLERPVQSGKMYKVKFDVHGTIDGKLFFGYAGENENYADKLIYRNSQAPAAWDIWTGSYNAANNSNGVQSYEFNFASNIPSDVSGLLGLHIQSQSSSAGTIYVDNIEISVIDSASYDFSDASQLQYSKNNASVQNGKLQFTGTGWNNIYATFDFVIENGKEYKVKFDLSGTTGGNVRFGYAGKADDSSPVLVATDYIYESNFQANETPQTVEFTFTSNIPNVTYNQLGFHVTTWNAGNIYVDNLEITPVVKREGYYDFSDASQLQYSKNNASVQNGKLQFTGTGWNNIYATFDFVIENNKEYKVKFDLSGTTGGNVRFGYAGKADDSSPVLVASDYIYESNFQANETPQTVEFTFTSNIPNVTYNQLGFHVTTWNAGNIYVDNLEIVPAEGLPLATYDFSSTSHVAYSYNTAGKTTSSVTDGRLHINLAGAAARIRLPFEFTIGANYEISYKVSANKACSLEVAPSYAGTNNDWQVTDSQYRIEPKAISLSETPIEVSLSFKAENTDGKSYLGFQLPSQGTTAENPTDIYIDDVVIRVALDEPNAPDIASVTETSITLMDMDGYEYKIESGEWQASPVFTNLVQGKTYSFYQRVLGNDNYGTSPASEAFEYFIAYFGDADRDGEVLDTDITLMRKGILSLKVEYDDFAADVNQDGVCDILDLVIVKKKLETPKFLGQNYWLTWSDEFNGSALNNDKWVAGSYDIADNGYGGVTHIAANNGNTVKLEDGYLKLNTYAENNQNGGTDYYTPELTTKNLNLKYGYFEIKAKMAEGNPFWHSFWACGKNTEEAPYRAEIDVFETMAASGKYNYTTHLWWDTTANNLPAALANNSEGCISSLLTGSLTNSTLASEFHTYGCKWTDTSLTYYFDGEIIAEVIYNQSANSEYFIALRNGNPMSLILSLSTARKYAGTIDNEALGEQAMLVDYIRIYQDSTISG